MYCRYCGKELTEGSKFCPFCGKACTDPADTTKQEGNFSDFSKSGITCPHCGSHNTEPLVHTSTQTHTGGYSCLGGACGGILLGPVGLLLGLCGRSTTTQTASQTRWVCRDCGTEFCNKQDEEKRLRFLLSSAFIMIIVTYTLTFLGFLISGSSISSTCFTLALAFFMFSLITWTSYKKGSCYRMDDLFAPQEAATLKRKYTASKFMFIGWIPFILVLAFVINQLNNIL